MAAAHNDRSTEEVRRELESERERLAQAVDSLRAEVKDATNVSAKLRGNLPVVAAGALGAGFLLAGGIGATMRLVFRRGREGKEKARFGRFSFVDRD
jgi:ornithine cyclodeaminase/alanine dehydrogenase-like protein (mu-crystallin family)